MTRSLTRRTFLSFLCASLIFLGVLPSFGAAPPTERSAKITVLQINDLYEITPIES